MNLPNRMSLAHLPTPINHLRRFSRWFNGVEVYLKRDDYTGLEYSGNKVRKLEYIISDVIENAYDVLITCGGLQSNHCRATAAVAAKYGLESHLLLKGVEGQAKGNLFLDKMFGAQCDFVSDDQYANNRMELMQALKKKYETENKKAYIIPEGASNGLGLFGYYTAMLEILEQEIKLDISFDTICVATGSGGTYAGLFLANQLMKTGKKIVGINIYDQHKPFEKIIPKLIEEGLELTKNQDLITQINMDDIIIYSDYIEGGYGSTSSKEIDFIKGFAKEEGIVLDHVYTGKALYGMTSEMLGESEKYRKNVLFIHTGGQFGTFANSDLFNL